MGRNLKEWISIKVAKQPGSVVLLAILLFNAVFIFLSAAIISGFSLSGTERMNIFEAAFCTITMILDAGCIQFVVADIGEANVFVALICICIILVGMVSFTGAVIGYITNYISGFVENANSGSRKLTVSNHIIILNWNTRASEIINDLLYCGSKQKVIVLAVGRKAEIEKEIEERLSDTITRENKLLKETCREYGFAKGLSKYRKEKLSRNVTVVVREGDVFSSKQLHDISLEHAKTVIILGNDINNTLCKFEHKEIAKAHNEGNSQIIKTLMQVSDIIGADYSYDDQRIIVEITDEWTQELVDKIIKCKQVKGKDDIVPIPINKVLGRILSQFSLMPELNLAYREFFSNKGASFHTVIHKRENEESFVQQYLERHAHAIPLTLMESYDETYAYFFSSSAKDIAKLDTVRNSEYSVKINSSYWIEKKNVVILGHNTKSKYIMQGFDSFLSEWRVNNGSEEILNIIVIDDQKSLEKMDFYREYPFVTKTVAAGIYDKELITATIEEFVSSNSENTSVLILSDDAALNEDIDANALAHLIYVQDIINTKKASDPGFDEESIDVIIEIIDPKHHDVVNSYSVNNVVISNRYISKMITQLGVKEALYDFYNDILTYDAEEPNGGASKEIYIKEVNRYFEELPEDCTAEEFVRAVYRGSLNDPECRNPTIVLGYVKPDGEMLLFSGDQSLIKVHLESKDKLIVFCDH